MRRPIHIYAFIGTLAYTYSCIRIFSLCFHCMYLRRILLSDYLVFRSSYIQKLVADKISRGFFWNRRFLAVVDGRLLNSRGGTIRMALREEPKVCTRNRNVYDYL